MKAKDLNSGQAYLASQAEKTPDQFLKKRMSSVKQQLVGVSNSTTPQGFNPNSRSRIKQSTMSNQGIENGNNSTENLFNLIQATKTKNTPQLEPLDNHKKTGSIVDDGQMMSPRDEIGIGL